MRDIVRRYGSTLTCFIVTLPAFWLLALVVLPYMILFEYSLRPYLPADQWGGPNDVYGIGNYLTFFTSPIHVRIFFLTDSASSRSVIALLYDFDIFWPSVPGSFEDSVSSASGSTRIRRPAPSR